MAAFPGFAENKKNGTDAERLIQYRIKELIVWKKKKERFTILTRP
jgi:hypothetical protein